jgi:hypothetical protein
MTIFVVNLQAEPVRLSLDWSAWKTPLIPVQGETVCDTLDLRQIDLINSWNAPNRIRTINLPITGDTMILPALSASAIDCRLF